MSNPTRNFDELVTLEAREIAKDILRERLAENDLPLPTSNIDIHLDQLIALDPTIGKSARERVTLRLDAYSRALEAIGIASTANAHSEALDI